MYCLQQPQCQICLTTKLIRSKNKSKCENKSCNAFVCDECLKSWYIKKQECPICHTQIQSLQDIESLQETQSDEENISQFIPIKNFCTCKCDCNCDCRQLFTTMIEKIPESIQFILSISFIGFLIFNFLALLSIGSFLELIQETKDFYTTWYFYLLFPYIGFICMGLVTCTYIKCEDAFNSTRRLGTL